MNYAEVLKYIHSMPKFVRGTANSELKRLLTLLGNPEDKPKYIHIAGTNGKGSVSFMLAEILKNAGYKTGLYTSPYIEIFNERFRIDGKMISDNELCKIVAEVKSVAENNSVSIPEFAFNTAIALYWFAKENCDIVVLETGLGGRLDSTNIIDAPIVSVITAVGLDHTQYLGDTLEQIAYEKSGIIKEDSNVVVYPIQKNTVFDIIKEESDRKNSILYIADVPIINLNTITVSNTSYILGMKGDFQAYNAATVIKTVEVLQKSGLKISKTDIKNGLKNAKNPARFEFFGNRIILDGAHNPQAMTALCKELSKINKNVYFCVAMMEDKEYAECARIIAEISSGIITTQLDIPRCCSAQRLAAKFAEFTENVCFIADSQKAFDKALKSAEPDGIVCVCGSMYLAGEIRRILNS